MRFAKLTFAGLCAFAASSLLYAQVPDFSGPWILESITPSGHGVGQQQVVRQTATTLTVGHSGGRHSIVYRLDGEESRSTVAGVESVSKVTWDGKRLVIVRLDNYPDGRKRNTKQVWSLDAGKRTIVMTEGERSTTLVYVRGK
jgi:hypothetical protein